MKKTAILDEETGEIIAPKIRTSMNYRLGDVHTDAERETGPSSTVPDQALSLPQLIARMAQGLPVPQKVPTYSNELVPDFGRMDLAEAGEYYEALKDETRGHKNFEELLKELREEDEEKQKAETQRKIDEENAEIEREKRKRDALASIPSTKPEA